MLDSILRCFVETQLRTKEAARKVRDQEGASAVEYGLLVALIAVVIVTAVGLLGGKLNDMFTSITTSI
jgi:pilus assembly protein Flp/PilA